MSAVGPDGDAHRGATAEPVRRVRTAPRPIVGLFGGTAQLAPERAALARDLGLLVARMDAHLLVASSYRVNEAAAEGFASVADRWGTCVANVPRGSDGALEKASSGDGAPICNVELALFTTVRNIQRPAENARLQRLNILTSDAVLVLPGSEWTPGELPAPAMRTGAHSDNPSRRRTILVGPAEEFAPELRAIFLQVATAAAAAAPLCRILEDQRFLIEAAPLM